MLKIVVKKKEDWLKNLICLEEESKNKSITSNAFRLIYILFHSPTGEEYSPKAILWKLGWSCSQMKKSVKCLVSLGYLYVHKKGSYADPMYYFYFPKISEKEFEQLERTRQD